MEQAIARLGTTPDSMVAQVKEKVGWFRSRFVDREFAFQDWTVDEMPLRELVAWPNGDVAGDVTPIQNDRVEPELAIAVLRTLLGDDSGRDWDTKMPDGRVALLFCSSCFDFGCGALTAELVVGDATVEWRDIGWQVDYKPLDLSKQENPVISLAFEKAKYEGILNELFAIERERQNSRSVGSSSPRSAS